MEMTFLNPALFERIVTALSWTLIHSLWQGLVLAILVGITLLATGKSRSVSRYNLLSALLFLFILINGITFFLEFRENPITPLTLQSFHYSENESFQVSAGSVPTQTKTINKEQIGQLLTSLLNDNVYLIAFIWFFIFAIKSLKLSAGILHLHRLNKSVSKVEVQWSRQVEQLARKLKISKEILLGESGMISSPVVVGILKPIIIVPIGFFTQIPVYQIEAILLHELAHIKRQDYLVNLLQSFVENFFFFNPAVYWLSALIREEREYCCDDMAINVMENKSSFVNALISFQEYKLSYSKQNVAFAGKKNHLLFRIKRILFNDKKHLNAMEKIFVTGCIIISTVLILAFSSGKKEENILSKTAAREAAPIIESGKKPIGKRNVTVQIDTSRVLTHQVLITDTLPKLPKPDNSLEEVKRQLDAVRQNDKGLLKLRIELWSLIQESRKQSTESKLRYDVFQKINNNPGALSEKLTAEAGNENLASEKLRSDEKLYQLNLALTKMKNEMLKRDSLTVEKKIQDSKAIERVLDKLSDSQQTELSRAELAYHTKVQQEIMSDLIRDGIIKNTENLSYRLHNKFFIVNGVVLPDPVHEKYKARFLYLTWKEWLYNFEGKTGYFVTGFRFSE